MAFYDYYCPTNGKTVEVQHSMAERLDTWGQVCQKAGLKTGPTPAKSPVTRLLSGITPATFPCKGLDKDEPTKKLNL